MENTLVLVGIGFSLLLCALLLMLAAFFGVRSIVEGRLRGVAVVSVALPAALGLVAYLLVRDWIEAGIWAMLVMLALTVAALLLSGVRSVFR